MKVRGGRAAPGRGRILALLASAVAPGVLYLVVRTASISVSPAAATLLPPKDASGALTPVLAATSHPSFRVPPALLQLGREAAVSAPTWYGSFLLQAKVAEREGRLNEAILLLEEVRRRRPNYFPARLLLITHYGKVGRYSQLLEEVDYGLRYSDQARQLLLPELAKLLANPAARPVLASMLARDPSWKKEFFQVAQARKVAPADALAFLQLRERSGGDSSEERELYIQSVFQTGQYQQARAMWLQSIPEREREAHAFVFNGSFKPSLERPPFGWSFQSLDNGRAEIGSGGASSYLDVSYFGSRGVSLAEQRTALTPGRYSLTVTAKMESETRSGALFWVWSCLPDGPEFARLSVSNVGARPRSVRTNFAVPQSGCAGQTLRLVGEPGDIAVPINGQIFKLEVRRES